MTKWVVVMVLAIFATGSSFPIFFTDQTYRSLEQLDEALANGEITQEYYDEAVDAFTGISNPESPIDADLSPKFVVTHGGRSIPQWGFASSSVQDLKNDYESVRYDRMWVRGRKYFGRFAAVKQDGQPHLVRELSLAIWRSRWRLEIGRLNTDYASGLTVGLSGLHGKLYQRDDFAPTLLFPTKHRKNGVQFNREFRNLNVSAFVSRLEGYQFFIQSFGGDFTRTFRGANIGLVFLRQQVGEFGNTSRTWNYFSPHLRMGSWSRILTAESSLRLGSATGHFVQYEVKSKKQSQSYIIFSYGTNYQNLESGGYAYSDYDEATLDEVGLVYREKRAGRRGVAIEQTFHFTTEKLSGQLVRWENRLDDRQCVAGRLTFEQSCRIPLLSRLRVQAIYQNLDIEHGTDTRKLITVTTKLMTSGVFIYENHHKIEQRVLESSKKYPFRSRHDFTWKITDDLETIAMINYYDSDLNSPGDNQLTFAVGQEIDTGRDFRFAGRLQTRYKFPTQKLDNWELRINLEVIL